MNEMIFVGLMSFLVVILCGLYVAFVYFSGIFWMNKVTDWIYRTTGDKSNYPYDNTFNYNFRVIMVGIFPLFVVDTAVMIVGIICVAILGEGGSPQ